MARRLLSPHGTLPLMNTEYLWWFAILVAVGVGAIVYLALGPVPEVEAEPGPAQELEPAPGTVLGAEPGSGSGPEIGAGPRPETRATDDQGTAGAAPSSSPVSTSVPGPAEPASTSETP